MATKRKMNRTKPAAKPSTGLGDDIQKVLENPVIQPVTETVKKLIWKDGKDCGCDKRKEQLNRLFPRNKPNCFNQQQYEDWTEVSASIKKTNKITAEQQAKIIMYLRNILNMSVAACSTCSSGVWVKYIEMLDKVAETYEN